MIGVPHHPTIDPLDEVRSRVAHALDVAESDPSRASELAQAALSALGPPTGGRARQDRSPDRQRITAEAWLAEGLAARARHEVDRAIAALRRAERLAAPAADPQLLARVRIALAGAWGMADDVPRALRVLNRLGEVSQADQAVALAQRAFLLQTDGRLDRALSAYREALPRLRASGDRMREANVLNNLAMIHLHQGAPRVAIEALHAATDIFEQLDNRWAAADVWINLAWAHARSGDLPTALAWFERADVVHREHGVIDPVALKDRCDVLLEARLIREARTVAAAAEQELSHRGAVHLLAEVRMQAARAALLDNDLAAAERLAGTAARALRRQSRPAMAALADLILVQIQLAAGQRDLPMLRRAERVAQRLQHHGWAALTALDARLAAATVALDLGRPVRARRQLALLPALGGLPASLRARVWHARALLALAEDDRSRALRALRAGLDVVERHQDSLGAGELRAYAADHGTEMAQLGLRLAVRGGSPDQVLAWAERHRAYSLRRPPARARVDDEVQRLLGELRQLHRRDEREVEGDAGAATRARQARLEHQIRRRTLSLPAASTLPAASGSGARGRVAALRRALGERALVEFVAVGDELRAVCVAANRPMAQVPLGSVTAARDDLEAVRFAIRRLALEHGTARSRAAVAEVLALASRRLDTQLLGPVTELIADRPLVLVPTGLLHALPWGALPRCRGRAVTVAPSAAIWLDRHRVDRVPAGPGPDHAVVIAGPGLPGAAEEAAQVAALYPQRRLLTGDQATVASVIRELDGAPVVHLAAHASFRPDHPAFSAFRLVDGPLTGYDLQAVSRAPSCLVLASCDAALSDVRPGDELRGLTAALLAAGAGSVIAAVAPVPDRSATDLMSWLHRELRSGASPSVALARARAQVGTSVQVTASAFVCFGGG